MKKIVSLILAVLMLACVLTGCANNDPAPAETPAASEEPTTIRVGAMTGPTAMGMVKLMDESDKGEAPINMSFRSRPRQRHLPRRSPRARSTLRPFRQTSHRSFITTQTVE